MGSREDESRARPPGFRALQGGLSAEAIAKLEPRPGDRYAIASDEGPWIRTAIRAIDEAAPDAPILVLSDKLGDEDLPDRMRLRQSGLTSMLRDDVDEQFDHLENLQRVTELRELLDPREKVGILLQPDPDPDGIASGLRPARAARTQADADGAADLLRRQSRAPRIRRWWSALGLDVRTVTTEELDEFDGLALVDVQAERCSATRRPTRVTMPVDAVIDHHPERTGYDAVAARRPESATGPPRRSWRSTCARRRPR